MQFGVCGDIDKARLFASVGFDFLELPLNKIATMDEEEYVEYKDAVLGSPIPSRVFNCFFPGDISLVGPDTDADGITAYLDRALSRMDELGGEVLVFGSGGSRSVPEGFPVEKAWEQLLQLMDTVGNMVRSHDILIVVEPLRRAESNIINTADEGLRFVRELDHECVRLLVDFYHLSQENETLSVLAKAGDATIQHIHIAEPETRKWPAPEDSDAYEAFIETLVSIGYNKTISVEGKTQDVNRDAPQALACLRGLWET